MNLLDYKYDMRLEQRTDLKLLKVAEDRGFKDEHGPQGRWITLFSTLFVSGGALKFNEDVPEEKRDKILNYLKQHMRSTKAKHADKTAVCAMLLSVFVDLD